MRGHSSRFEHGLFLLELFCRTLAPRLIAEVDRSSRNGIVLLRSRSPMNCFAIPENKTSFGSRDLDFKTFVLEIPCLVLGLEFDPIIAPDLRRHLGESFEESTM